jgi:transcriptional regulator with XRE-family HTH domain
MKYDPSKLSSLLKDDKVKISGIARSTGLSVSYLTRLRDGQSVPSAEVLASIASVFQKRPSFFYDESFRYSENGES